MKQKILILAYPGTGKTFLAEHYSNVSDMEFQHYRWDYGEFKNLPLEELKGKKDFRKPNPAYPNNFFVDLKKEFNRSDIVLVPMATSILNEVSRLKDVRIILVIKEKEAFDDLIKIYKARNNSEEFIISRTNDFEKFYDIVKNSSYEKIFLNKDEHLSQAIQKIGLKLIEGKGYKNYK